MKKEEVKSEVYIFVNGACKLLNYWISSMYQTNHFILMDAKTETPNFYSIEELEKDLKEKGFSLALDSDIKKEAILHNYIYEEFA